MSKLILLVIVLSYFSTIMGFSFLGDINIPKIQKTMENFKKAQGAQKVFGDKKVCVITGTSSGLGRQTVKQLIKTGEWFVIGAVRDLDKMAEVATEDEFPSDSFMAMECDLASFDSVRKFTTKLQEFKSGRPLDRLVCNAAVYQPTLDYAKYSEDNIEQQTQINFLSHFLMCSLLIDDMRNAQKPRIVTVGSVTGNDNTVGGGGVYPLADLRDLQGLAQGARQPVAMMDGYPFNGAKAYKDSKLAVMMMANLLHDNYFRATGIAFSSIYPGCIAESPLFREKRPWFRKYFPVFMKFITGGFVGEEEAGQRLFQVIHDPRCSKSGVYWSWNGGPRQGRGLDAIKNGGNIVGAGGAGGDWDSIYENDQSDRVRDPETARLLWKYATDVTGAEWPLAKSPKSPCPTLVVIGFITSLLDKVDRQKMEKMGKLAGREPEQPKSMKEALGRLAF